MSRQTKLAAFAAAFLTVLSAHAAGTPSPPNAEAYIIWPPDGAVITGGKLWVRMGLRNMGVCPKGVDSPNCGHHHLIVDGELPAAGEPIPSDVLAHCFEEAERADCMIVAGTSATVYPAAQFPIAIKEKGGDLLEVNPYETEISALCPLALRGPAGEVLPQLVERVRGRR